MTELQNQYHATVESTVATLLDRFSGISDNIWDYAELGFLEKKSSAEQIDELTAQGFTIERGVAGMETAFVASYGEGAPVIAVLGEFDALAGLSQMPDQVERVPIKAGEPGHGCGHNLLGVAAMLAVTTVKRVLAENNLPGTIRYYGCPAEEGGSGKVFMVRGGLFDDVDIALAWHPAQFNYVWDGIECLGIVQKEYAFKGVSSHAAASPQLGRSALDAAELMTVGVNYLREHVIQEARLHYAYLDAGGPAANIVQAHAKLAMIVRAPHMDDVFSIAERIDRIAEGASLMTDTSCTVETVSGTSNLIANPVVFDRYELNLRAALPVAFSDEELAYAAKFKASYGGENDAHLLANIKRNYPDRSRDELEAMLQAPMPNYYCTETGSPASTDVGDVSWVVPTGQLHVACYPAGTPFHSWQLTAMGKSPLVHRAMGTAATVLANTALDFLLDSSLVQTAKEKFEEQLAGSSYRSPIPATRQPEDYLKKD